MRRASGQVALALNLVIAIFIVGSLGLAAYEMSRVLLARDQLKHSLELAALAGTASLASTSATGSTALNEAKTVAINILKMNSILGTPLTSTVREVTSLSALNPVPSGIDVYVEFDDPITKQPTANPSNVMRLYGAYKYVAFSGGFGSVGVYTCMLEEQALSSLPALDLVIVHDSSGSMDDGTNVTFVRRYFDPSVNPPQPSYTIPNPGGIPEQGPLGTLLCPTIIGSQVNGLEPQNLDAAGDPKTANCPKEFSEVGTMGTTVPLRGVMNTGSMPGDAPPSLGGVGLAGMTKGPGNTTDTYAIAPGRNRWSLTSAILDFGKLGRLADFGKFSLEQSAEAAAPAPYNPWGADPSMFTDMVVNLDGNAVYAGGTYNGFSFPDYRWLVEAARGNLENGSVAPNGLAPLASTPMEGAAAPGYQNAYRLAAYSKLEPKGTLERAVKGFMSKVLESSDCHFGFVAFGDRAGTSPTDFDKGPRISWAYPVAGKVKYLVPAIPLNSTNNNYTTINTLLSTPATSNKPMFVPNGGANLAAGLQQAQTMLNGPGARSGAMKAILVVTDKVPTRDLAGKIYNDPAANGPALNDAVNVATNLGNAGIPIFVVGLDQVNGQMTPYMSTQFSDTAAGGLVNAAGHGGVLHLDTWVDPTTTLNTLTGKFNNIVRQLVVLTRG
ncbi:MAG TPA: vWA domain-containing protein [Chroococcales cyanobacterium]